MNIKDPFGYLTEERIALAPLQTVIDQCILHEHPQRLAEIKFAKLYLLGQHEPEHIDGRTRAYFLKLQELGILGASRLVDKTLLHEVKGQLSKLVGVEMPDGNTYYLHMMTSDKVINQTLRALEQAGNQPVSTLTGICLFGSGVDSAITCDGNRLPVSEVGGLLPEIPDKKIEDILIDRHISLYETYKIKHFSAFLNTLIGSCRRGFGDAYLMTPADQYPLYLVPAFIEGKISSEVFQKWVSETRIRADAVFRMFAKRLSAPLMLLPSPLELVAGYVTSEIAANRIPSLGKVLEVLGNQDELWEALLLEQDNVPTSWRELKLLSYVRGVIEAAMDAEAKGNFLLTVDDISEKPMANAYAKVRRKLRREGTELPRVLGLYAPASIVAADRSKNSYLYGYAHASAKDFRTIVSAYRPQP